MSNQDSNFATTLRWASCTDPSAIGGLGFAKGRVVAGGGDDCGYSRR